MLDSLIKGGSVVFPNHSVKKVDIGILGGKIVQIGEDLDSQNAHSEISAVGKFVFPGGIDGHFHAGIYNPLAKDARSESASAIAGGVTTVLSYFRTGRNYMNTSAPYSILFKEVLDQSRSNYYTDYAYHLAPITREHVREMPSLVRDFGVTTFKFYMFYRGLDIKGEPKKGAVKNEYLLSDDPYDLGHLYKIMTEVAKLRKEVGSVRLCVHAEDAEFIRANLEAVRESPGELNPLELYNRARPPESERLAIIQVVELALETGCPIIILHLSSGLGLSTISELRRRNPSLSVAVETTGHYLVLTDKDSVHSYGKVNPPIRTQSDVDSLWRGVESGEVDTVGSDHVCTTVSRKGSDVWSADPGFASVELLYPILVTEGYVKRHIPLEKVVALLTSNPANHFGLSRKKGDIAIGVDADLVISDLSLKKKANHTEQHSAQDFSPFDGIELVGWPETTILRGKVVYEKGQVIGPPSGEYLNRWELGLPTN